MVESYLLGMDCGTTNIKAIILGEDGQKVAEASQPSRFITPGPNCHEQDANDWWRQTVEIFRSLSRQVGPQIMRRVRGISISSHTVSLLPVDDQGRPLRNAMTYQDSRSSEELGEILEKVGLDRFVSIVGGQPSVTFLPSKILWFKKHEPELFARTAHFLQANSYLNFKLTGKYAGDTDQAGRSQCLDMKTFNWSKEIGDAIGIDLNRYMPKLRLVDEIIGFVTDEAAEETGLYPGTPVIAGCSDAMASMYAMGLSSLGEAGESSGTTSIVFVGSNKKSAMDIPVVTRPCPIDGMPWVFDAPIQASGIALKWYIDNFAGDERRHCDEHNLNIYTYLNERALKSRPGAGGLMFFPYLMGERAPLWNDYARGMFIGMNLDTTRDDVTRSIFEGTAFALRHVIETIKEAGGQCRSLRICGGGAKSRAWSMIKASMLNCPVYVLNHDSGDVPVGDALIVGHKLGVFPSLTEAVKQVVKVDEVIQPNEEWVRIYDRMYPYYVDMYKKLDGDLKKYKADIEEMQ